MFNPPPAAHTRHLKSFPDADTQDGDLAKGVGKGWAGPPGLRGYPRFAPSKSVRVPAVPSSTRPFPLLTPPHNPPTLFAYNPLNPPPRSFPFSICFPIIPYSFPLYVKGLSFARLLPQHLPSLFHPTLFAPHVMSLTAAPSRISQPPTLFARRVFTPRSSKHCDRKGFFSPPSRCPPHCDPPPPP